jgi:Zn-dependent protease with chaperone function
MKYKLLFRKGGHIGANAFALPDGTVVITDELIELATHDKEILSILMHELGHVIHRHSLRRVISHSGLAVLTVLITGDVSSAGELVLALPNILMDSSYSRDHEWEADGYALKTMQKQGIPTSRFADIMERLESYQAEFEASPDNDDKTVDNKEYENADDSGYGWSEYISSHPASKDRIARFRDAKNY